jgi:hypothetical protein
MRMLEAHLREALSRVHGDGVPAVPFDLLLGTTTSDAKERVEGEEVVVGVPAHARGD